MTSGRVDRTSLPDGEDWETFADLVTEFAFVAVNERDRPVRWAADALPCYEVVYVAEGRLNMWVGERCVPGEAGDVFVIPPRTLHHEETPDGEVSGLICLGANFRRRSGRHQAFPMPLQEKVHVGRGHLVEQRLRRIAAEIQGRSPGYSAIVLAAVLEIFCELSRAACGIAEPAEGCADESLVRFGRRVQEYIRAHSAEPLSVDAMAAHFHLSRPYFNKLFRRATGQTPHAYLAAVRLERAKALLADSDVPVKAIAQEIGFEDPYYFARCFRRHVGVTPTQYRRQAAAV